MKTNGYCTTALEDWVAKLYLKLGIIHPNQINIYLIARYLHIYVHHKPINSYFEVVGRYRGINIDCRKSAELHREIFFHELCHILRHAGIQTMMPEAFRELQEWDAQHFVTYAAIPYHMLKYIRFDDPLVLEQMSEMFKVSKKLCLQRLNQLKRRGYFLNGNVPENAFICD
ncbi:ImmA/IrrE family metallo-endopeptidase [Heyndrickxia ginsengihumi]|uniref:ImmA/IrrE family metallo-endopeptidase n=1 Tax=Heyndrickxia ginsengihumi TaxID=363870 RepID=UPI00068BCB29|nr:ImmA/IrrE family metallo-endopeptidase [Heyndrickxia ginsengihumi]